MRITDDNGLTGPEERFCQYLARAFNQSDAYRHAFRCSKATNEVVQVRACRLAAKLQVRARVRAILIAAKIPDLSSPGEAYARVLTAWAAAFRAENWTAVAALSKSDLQVQGLMRDNLTITHEQLLPDADMALMLARGDEAKAAQIRAIMGEPSFGPAPAAQDVVTKH